MLSVLFEGVLPKLPLMFSPSFLQNITTELTVGETDQTIMGKITVKVMVI